MGVRGGGDSATEKAHGTSGEADAVGIKGAAAAGRVFSGAGFGDATPNHAG